MEIIAGWVFLSFLVALLASSRDRSHFFYFALSMLLSPFLVVIVVLILPSLKPIPIRIGGEIATPDTHVRCPDCRELVRHDAKKCKHCATALIPQ